MTDVGSFVALLEHSVGPFAATCLAIAAVVYKLLPSLRKEQADSDGQISALDAYKELLKEEREARIEAEKRLDRFAEERNKAVMEIAHLRSQVQTLTATVQRQNEEVDQLRQELTKLRLSINRSLGA